MANAQQNRDLAIFQLVVYLVLTPFVLFVFIKVGRRSLRNVPGWIWPISEWFWMMGFFGLVLGSSGLTISAGLLYKHDWLDSLSCWALPSFLSC
jgi:hypothetical protein